MFGIRRSLHNIAGEERFEIAFQQPNQIGWHTVSFPVVAQDGGFIRQNGKFGRDITGRVRGSGKRRCPHTIPLGNIYGQRRTENKTVQAAGYQMLLFNISRRQVNPRIIQQRLSVKQSLLGIVLIAGDLLRIDINPPVFQQFFECLVIGYFIGVLIQRINQQNQIAAAQHKLVKGVKSQRRQAVRGHNDNQGVDVGTDLDGLRRNRHQLIIIGQLVEKIPPFSRFDERQARITDLLFRGDNADFGRAAVFVQIEQNPVQIAFKVIAA